jgi:hypothetical protein
MESWKPTRYGKTFPWTRVINKYFLGYEIEDVFSIGPSRHYITGVSRGPDENTPRGGGFEYLSRSPARRRRRRKGDPVPWGIIGPPGSWDISTGT